MPCTVIKRYGHDRKNDQKKEVQCKSRMTSDLDRSQGSASECRGGQFDKRGENGSRIMYDVRLRRNLNGTTGRPSGKRVACEKIIENSLHLFDKQEAHTSEMRVWGTHNCVLDVGHALRACRFSKKALLSTELRPWCKKWVNDLGEMSSR